MLNHHFTPRRVRRAAQQGMVLLVALVVLVAIMIAGVAMMRSVDTATLVAGNLAFQQSATYAADKGVEAAIQMLHTRSDAGTLSVTTSPANGYVATLRGTCSTPPCDNPQPGQSWQSFWQEKLAGIAVNLPADDFGNQVSYVVQRLCSNAAPPGAGGQCVASPAVTKTTGNSQEAGDIQLSSSSQIYYRITVRVAGPRRTESYVQTHVAM